LHPESDYKAIIFIKLFKCTVTQTEMLLKPVKGSVHGNTAVVRN